jgi:hypothetical protein
VCVVVRLDYLCASAKPGGKSFNKTLPSLPAKKAKNKNKKRMGVSSGIRVMHK